MLSLRGALFFVQIKLELKEQRSDNVDYRVMAKPSLVTFTTWLSNSYLDSVAIVYFAYMEGYDIMIERMRVREKWKEEGTKRKRIFSNIYVCMYVFMD